MCQELKVQVVMEKPKSDSQSNTEGWKAINWRQVERYVFKLQKRIYAASRCGDIKRVRKLQKTLMRSWSNRVISVRRVTQDNTGKKTAGVSALIKDLNPVIRGWASYYRASDAGTSEEFNNQDRRMYLSLRKWAKRRTKKSSTGHQLYWTTQGNNNWVFATRVEENPLRLLTHIEFHSSSDDYVKVKDDKSPYNGELVYWSSRLGEHPEMPSRKAKLLKQQKGKCTWCGLHFRDEDILEVDHKNPLSSGGTDEWKNLQLLHRHCHDEKTAIDGSLKSSNDKRKTH
jgi:RNA-directed DNA polymerase